MERIDWTDEFVKFLFSGWSSADTVISEAFVEVSFCSVGEKNLLNDHVTLKKIASKQIS